MKSFEEIKETPRVRIYEHTERGVSGELDLDYLKFKGTFVAGFDEGGMEHVSVSSFNHHKLPTWEAMCKVKDIFWDAEEMVVQIHPPESEYVHSVRGLENVLHLWRPADGDWSRLDEKKWRGEHGKAK